MDLRLSSLGKTWLIDLDGTLLQHNGFILGEDKALPGAREFTERAYETGRVVILTAREKRYKQETVSFLNAAGIRYHDIIFDMPVGERILINDEKPSGLKTAFAINVKRNAGMDINIIIDESL